MQARSLPSPVTMPVLLNLWLWLSSPPMALVAQDASCRRGSGVRVEAPNVRPQDARGERCRPPPWRLIVSDLARHTVVACGWAPSSRGSNAVYTSAHGTFIRVAHPTRSTGQNHIDLLPARALENAALPRHECSSSTSRRGRRRRRWRPARPRGAVRARHAGLDRDDADGSVGTCGCRIAGPVSRPLRESTACEAGILPRAAAAGHACPPAIVTVVSLQPCPRPGLRYAGLFY